MAECRHDARTYHKGAWAAPNDRGAASMFFKVGRKLIFFVRNPVAEKVQVTEGTGLSNVKAVADKYGGDFAVSCDGEKFNVVVML